MTELPKINISNPLDELFSTEEERQSSQQERIVTIDCNEIDSFQKHPFKVRDNQDMDELIESIQKNGVIMPCIVRPKENGRYEMVSGHRRKHAAIRAGLDSLPCIVRDLDDIQATILMVDSNAHRPYILPSEKAYSYKMKLEAMKRQAGRPNIENGVPVGHNSFVGKSREILAAESQDSNTQIQRYVRLTYLIPELLQMVDNSVEKPIEAEALSMAMRPAVELSYLSPENQKIVLDFMQDTLSTPSHAQATVNEERVLIGSAHFIFEDEGVTVPLNEQERFDRLPEEYSHLYLAIGRELAAVICISDPLRREAKEVLTALRALGIQKTVMLTGDSYRTASTVANRLGVDAFCAEVLPADKAKFVADLRQKGHIVLMVGDGINDSPALSEADAGIAISDGAAIAREIADITIAADSLWELVKLRRIAMALMERIHSNYRFVIGFNGTLIGLGLAGILPPAASAALHNLSTLGVSLRSMSALPEPKQDNDRCI